jgi:ComF family protein
MPSSVIKNIIEAFSGVINLFFPLFCASCNANISTKCFPVCPGCRESILYISGLEVFNDIACPEISGYLSIGLYDGVLKRLISGFKYHKKKYLAPFFARELTERFKQYIPFKSLSNFDVIVPVPLHESKLKARGFNQSELLASEIGKITGVEVCADAVNRIKETREQNKLHYKERFINVEDAFEINYKNIYQIKSKNVIIVDDIITTAATVKSLARLLKKYGALDIFVLGAARTLASVKP